MDELCDKNSRLKHKEKKDRKQECCKSCICEQLLIILKHQNIRTDTCSNACDLKPYREVSQEVIPFILQTPYGDSFFTWGNIGESDCFVTVFFKVIKVDCKKNCAILQLLKPNINIVDPDTGSIEIANICKVDFVTLTRETVLVELNCYSAIKAISPKMIKK